MSTVLLVTKSPGNVRVLGDAFRHIGYTSVAVSDEPALNAAIAHSPRPLVGVVDVSAVGPTAWSFCAALREHDIPFVVLFSARGPGDVSRRCMASGAASVLQKPVPKSHLMSLVGGLMASA